MIECPDCHGVLKPNARRCACGWVEASLAAPRPSASLVDPHRWDCAFEDRGQRCAEMGRFTESTTGSGRIFCLDHFPPFRAMRAGLRGSAPTPAFKAIQATMRRLADVPLDDPEADAERRAIQFEHRHKCDPGYTAYRKARDGETR